MNKQNLPIFQKRKEILQNVERSQFTIIVSATGSGKTTQVPQFLLKAGWASNGVIAVTQPRRVAAVTVATRVSKEIGCKLGEKVGYSIRFEKMVSSETKIKYITDGMLIRDLMNDSLLRQYSVIILDEAHERTINTDLLFALVKNISEKRTELKVLVMSATLSTHRISEYFNNAPIINVEGRLFDVKTMYLEKEEVDVVEASVITVLQIHTELPKGHILVFLSGQEEIERAKKFLSDKIKAFPSLCNDMKIFSLYSSLPTKKQVKVFENVKEGVRKVILSTNIAETSVTIDGVIYVVDNGFSKKRFFDYRKRTDVMLVNKISKNEAIQRQGRAGRICPGICFRLYKENTFDQMNNDIIPEILRTNLSSFTLLIKSITKNDENKLKFIEPPRENFIKKATAHLCALGALNSELKLTSLGKKMAILPIDPIYSKSIFVSIEENSLNSVLTIISILSSENVWVSNSKNQNKLKRAKIRFSENKLGDLLAYLNIFSGFYNNNLSKTWCKQNCVNYRCLKRSIKIRYQLKEHLQKMNISTNKDECFDLNSIRKSLSSGFFINTAALQPDKSYRTLKDRQLVKIHPSSVLFGKKPECVIFSELIKPFHSKTGYMKGIAIVKREWFVVAD